MVGEHHAAPRNVKLYRRVLFHHGAAFGHGAGRIANCISTGDSNKVHKLPFANPLSRTLVHEKTDVLTAQASRRIRSQSAIREPFFQTPPEPPLAASPCPRRRRSRRLRLWRTCLADLSPISQHRSLKCIMLQGSGDPAAQTPNSNP